MSCVPTGISNSSSNFWKRKGYPSSGTLVFRESGIGSSLGGMKGHKIIVEKNGMHSKFGTRKGKKGEEPLHQIKRKALDGRRFKELWKNRAKTANASGNSSYYVCAHTHIFIYWTVSRGLKRYHVLDCGIVSSLPESSPFKLQFNWTAYVIHYCI